MRTMLPKYLVCLLAAATMASACGDDDSDNGDGGNEEADWSCLAKACVNDDYDTHTDCGCDADYCFPAIGGASFLGLEELTCTKKECKEGDSSSCPPGYECKPTPPRIIKKAKDDYDITLPSTMCGKK